jgi:hypothetical protein
LPKPEDLPEKLRELVHRHGVELRDGEAWPDDVARLIKSVERALGTTTPPPSSRGTATPRHSPLRKVLLGGAGSVALIVSMTLCSSPSMRGMPSTPVPTAAAATPAEPATSAAASAAAPAAPVSAPGAVPEKPQAAPKPSPNPTITPRPTVGLTPPPSTPTGKTGTGPVQATPEGPTKGTPKALPTTKPGLKPGAGAPVPANAPATK